MAYLSRELAQSSIFFIISYGILFAQDTISEAGTSEAGTSEAGTSEAGVSRARDIILFCLKRII